MITGEEISMEHIEELVSRHMAFIIRTVSNLTGRYVSVEYDDEFSIALAAFAEAVQRYEPERGKFLTFAGLVIQSRVKTYLQQNRRYPQEISLEGLQERGQDFSASRDKQKESLKEEIREFQSELSSFGLTLDVLADKAPKHSDTRKRAIDIAEQSSQDEQIVKHVYKKKKLLVRDVCRFCGVTEKIVKGSKCYILATMIVFIKRLPLLIQWIRSAGCAHVR